MKRLSIAALSAALLASQPAIASDSYSGTITGIQLVDTGSMQFRVTLSSAMTNCNLNFAFVETSSALFSAYSAGLMTAYSQGRRSTSRLIGKHPAIAGYILLPIDPCIGASANRGAVARKGT